MIPDSARSEEARILSAYAKRNGEERYSQFNMAHLLMLQTQQRGFLRLLRRFGFDPLVHRRFLEVGCGTGYWLRQAIEWGVRPENVVGVDISLDRIEKARRMCPAKTVLECSSASHLGFEDESFDLILQSTVFSSILDNHVRMSVASEMTRVLKQNGLILWFDLRMNNPENSDVRAIGRREIQSLFPGFAIAFHRLILAPPIARRVAPVSTILCELLSRIPFLCTHYLAGIRRG